MNLALFQAELRAAVRDARSGETAQPPRRPRPSSSPPPRRLTPVACGAAR